MNELQNVHEAVSEALLNLLQRKSSWNYECPVDVDRHDNCVDAIKQDIEALIKIRAILEERLAG